jgi:hypothetical protein
MKDKIIEILKQFTLIGADKNGKPVNCIIEPVYSQLAKEIDSLYHTHNRDKVMGIFRTTADDRMLSDGDGGEVYCGALFPDQWDEAADALCSLSLPTPSEEQVMKLADKYKMAYVEDARGTAYHSFKAGFNAAIKELTKKE